MLGRIYLELIFMRTEFDLDGIVYLIDRMRIKIRDYLQLRLDSKRMVMFPYFIENSNILIWLTNIFN